MKEVYKYGDNVVVDWPTNSPNFGRYVGPFNNGSMTQWHVVIFHRDCCTPSFFNNNCESAEKIISYDYFSDGLVFDIGRIAAANPTAKFFLTATNIRHQTKNENSTLKEMVDRLESEVR